MRLLVRSALLLAILLAGCSATRPISPSTPYADPPARAFAADSVRADLALLRRALLAYHPSLDVYGQRAEVLARLAALDTRLAARRAPVPEGDVVLAVAEVLAAVRSGHTTLNPFNQSDGLRARLWGGGTVLPFTFRIVGDGDGSDRLVVTRDLSGGALPRGTEVLALDGVPVPAVLDRLQTVSPGDGRGTDALRRARLAVSDDDAAAGGWPLFDLHYPLAFPAAGAPLRLTVRLPGGAAARTLQSARITRGDRVERLQAAGVTGFDDERAWAWRMLDAQTAYVRIGSFLSWRFQTPADTLLARTFAALRAQGARRLVLDLRGVGGGTLGYETVARYLTARTVPCDLIADRLIAAERADPALFPYLTSPQGDGWKQPLPDGALERQSDGRFRIRGAAACPPVQPAPEAFDGPVAVLADEANVSATFLLLAHLRRHGLATIVGRPAGGNRRGFDGGLTVMLTLPRSGLVIDLPLFAQPLSGDAPDAPLAPDVPVRWTPADVADGRDPDLDTALRVLNRR